MKYLFPSIQILTCLGAAVMYALQGDWRRVIYWTAASIITGSVTF